MSHSASVVSVLVLALAVQAQEDQVFEAKLKYLDGLSREHTLVGGGTAYSMTDGSALNYTNPGRNIGPSVGSHETVARWQKTDRSWLLFTARSE